MSETSDAGAAPGSAGPPAVLWRQPSFLKFWAAQSISAVGSRVTRTAFPVMAVLAIDGGPLQLGLLSALSMAPGAVLGLLASGRIDRSEKRPLLIGADLVRAALVLTVPIAAWFGVLTMTQLYGVGALLGCATALFQIADNAYLPALVGKAQLLEANAKIETTESIAEISGPGLAGVLIELLTAPFAIVLDAASYVVSALLLLRVRATETVAVATADDTLASDLLLGISACWREPRVRLILLSTAVSTLAAGGFFALYMLYTLGVLGLSPGTVGLIISVGGIGSLFGAFLSPRLSARIGVGPTMFVCLAIGQAGGLLIPLADGSTGRGLVLLVAHQFIGDGFVVAFWIQAVTLRQSALPATTLARANGVFTVVGGLLLPLGSLLAGAAGEALGVRRALWAGVSLGLLAPLFLWPLAARELGRRRRRARRRSTETRDR